MTILSDLELENVTGGSFWSEISKIFGREGKPFIGRDLVEFVAGAGATAAAVACPPLAPFAEVIGVAAANRVSKIYDEKNRS